MSGPLLFESPSSWFVCIKENEIIWKEEEDMWRDKTVLASNTKIQTIRDKQNMTFLLWG